MEKGTVLYIESLVHLAGSVDELLDHYDWLND